MNTSVEIVPKASLAIDCSSELCSVALNVDGQVSFREKLAPREHAYLVLPFAEALLKEKSLHFNDLNNLVFARGPGAFTGLRVAASVAQGLAFAYEKPLLAFSSLQLLALQMDKRISLSKGDQVVAVLDARMSELYWASFTKTEDGLKLSGDEQLGSVVQLKECIDRSAYFIGPGCRYLHDSLNKELCLNFDRLSEFSEVFPHAKDLFTLLEGEKLSVSQAQSLPFPVYLRNHVAEKSTQTAKD